VPPSRSPQDACMLFGSFSQHRRTEFTIIYAPISGVVIVSWHPSNLLFMHQSVLLTPPWYKTILLFLHQSMVAYIYIFLHQSKCDDQTSATCWHKHIFSNLYATSVRFATFVGYYSRGLAPPTSFLLHKESDALIYTLAHTVSPALLYFSDLFPLRLPAASTTLRSYTERPPGCLSRSLP